MNTIGTFTAAVSIVSLLLAPGVLAQQEMEAEQGTESTPSHQEMTEPGTQAEQEVAEPPAQTATEEKATNILKASEIIGYSVKNPEGEELGQIEDVVIDPADGRVAYAVLSFGGFLGMGDKLFATPWEALTSVPEQQAFSLDANQEKLKNAPGFDKNNWPDMANREWGMTVHEYYGQKPYWEEESETSVTPQHLSAEESAGQHQM
jgi:sporulation protein YlmC with PRC-barrel domain